MEKRFLRTWSNAIIERRFDSMNQMYKICKQKGLLPSIFQGYFFYQITSLAQLWAGVHPDTHCHIILFSKKTAIKGKIYQPPGCHTDLPQPLLCFQKLANKRVSKKQKVEPAKLWQREGDREIGIEISKRSTGQHLPAPSLPVLDQLHSHGVTFRDTRRK